jgi:hypothetical protein
MPLCDSSGACPRAVRPEPSPAVLLPRWAAGISEVSRFGDHLRVGNHLIGQFWVIAEADETAQRDQRGSLRRLDSRCVDWKHNASNPAPGITGDVRRVPLLPALLRPRRGTGSSARLGKSSGSRVSLCGQTQCFVEARTKFLLKSARDVHWRILNWRVFVSARPPAFRWPECTCR